MSPGRGRFRAARGLVLSAACLLVPTTAHVIAGGGAPTTGPFLFGAALLSVASIGLAERRLPAGSPRPARAVRARIYRDLRRRRNGAGARGGGGRAEHDAGGRRVDALG